MGFNLRRALSRTAKTILAKAAEPAVIYFSLAAAPLAAQAAQAGQAVVEEATVAAVPVGQDALVHIAEHIKVAKEAVSPYAAQAGETIVKGAKAAGDSMGPKIGEAIKSVGKRVSAAAVAIKPYTKDMHPAVPIFFGVTVAIGVIYLVYRYVVPAVLRIVGFSGKGVVAGSAAAGIQAGIGNVAAGSLFAGAQSVAMGGILSFPAIGSIAAAGLGGLADAEVAAAVQDVNLFVVFR